MKTAFLFSGQGAQYPGMMADFDQAYPACHELFEEADRILGRSISSLCFHGTGEELSLTHNTQPCTLVCDLVVYKALESEGIKPDGYAGFSLGEYAALCASGALSFQDALRLVQTRADAMQKACPEGMGAMAAVKRASVETIEGVCEDVRSSGGQVWPVNYNSPKQIVISGEKSAVEAAVQKLSALKARAIILPVSAPFHTPLLQKATEVLESEFAEIDGHDARLPVYQNLDAKPHTSWQELKENTLRQTVSPVRWMQTITQMHEDGFTRFLELGPGHTLTSFTSAILTDDDETEALALGTVESLRAACSRAGDPDPSLQGQRGR